MAAARLMVARCWRVLASHLLRDLLRGCVDPGRPPPQHGGGARPLVGLRVTDFFFLVSIVAGPALTIGLIFATFPLIT